MSPNVTGNDQLGAGLLSISAFLVEVFFLENARIGLQLNWPKQKMKEKQQPLTNKFDKSSYKSLFSMLFYVKNAFLLDS